MQTKQRSSFLLVFLLCFGIHTTIFGGNPGDRQKYDPESWYTKIVNVSKNEIGMKVIMLFIIPAAAQATLNWFFVDKQEEANKKEILAAQAKQQQIIAQNMKLGQGELKKHPELLLQSQQNEIEQAQQTLRQNGQILKLNEQSIAENDLILAERQRKDCAKGVESLIMMLPKVSSEEKKIEIQEKIDKLIVKCSEKLSA